MATTSELRGSARASLPRSGERRARAVAFLARPGVALWATFALVGGWLAYKAQAIESFNWLVDELLYMKAGLTFGKGEAFLLPEVHGGKYGPPNGLYPRLMSPFYTLFGAVNAFRGVHVANALLFASTMFPTYLIGRRLGMRAPWAIAAGVLSVLVPFAITTLIVMTESIAYPTFMWAIYASCVAVADPRPRHDALALLAIGVATYARTQFLLLIPLFLVSILLVELAARPGTPEAAERRARLRGHAPLAAMLVGIVVFYFAAKAVGLDLIGTYGGLFSTSAFPPQVWWNVMEHLSHIVVAIGILPMVGYIAWLARVAIDPAGRFERSVAVVGGLTSVVVVYQAGWFAQNIAGGQVQERYAFYIIPLLMLGFVALAADGRRLAPRLSLMVGGVVTAAIIAGGTFTSNDGLGTFERLSSAGRGIQELLKQRINFLWPLANEPRMVDVLVGAAIVSALLAVAFLAAKRRRYLAPLLVGLVGLWGFTSTKWLLNNGIAGVNTTIPGLLSGVEVPGYYNGTPRDWIDRAVGEDAQVGTFSGRLGVQAENFQWTWHEFWNNSVTRSYIVADRPSFSGFGTIALGLDAQTGAFAPPKVRTRYLVTPGNDPTMAVRGRVVARAMDSAAVIEPGPQWRLRYWLSGGTYEGNTQGGTPLQLFVYPEPGRRATAQRVTLRLELIEEGPRRVGYTMRSGDRSSTGVLADGDPPRFVTLETVPDASGTRSVATLAATTFERLPDGREVGLRAGVVRVR